MAEYMCMIHIHVKSRLPITWRYMSVTHISHACGIVPMTSSNKSEYILLHEISFKIPSKTQAQSATQYHTTSEIFLDKILVSS